MLEYDVSLLFNVLNFIVLLIVVLYGIKYKLSSLESKLSELKEVKETLLRLDEYIRNAFPTQMGKLVEEIENRIIKTLIAKEKRS